MKTPTPIDRAQTTPPEPSLLKQAFLAMQAMQAKLDAAERRNTEPIAIVGMGCRFPGGANNLEAFWNLLRAGRDAISLVPSSRWDADAYYDLDPDRPGKMVTRWGGFLDQVDGFDAAFFGIAPREAASMDPQQRLALEVAWETLENAGYAPAALIGTRAGVFLGIASGDYNQLNLETGDPELLDAHYASGVAHSIAAGRISYLLGLEGPSIALDTACSSSLVAVHLACQSLRARDCSLALAGGVNVMLAPATTALLSRVRMLSPGGRCKAFDESADGFVRGEGCGFVALKLLSQAQADGDRILAVIRGTAVNQDGASSSLTAPNGPAQVALLRQALASAGVTPDQVSYIEAHGTGTALGDPIELQALGAVYGSARAQKKPLLVGSLKTNMGHLEAAAGIAGLIKTVLALEHRQIPAHLHLTRPTSHVRWDELHLAVPRQLTDWPVSDAARIAAVSSFGFSGTNAHVLVAEAPAGAVAASKTNWPLEILTVSAKTKTALQTLVRQYAESLETHSKAGDLDLHDFCFTANTGRSHFAYRACFVAPDVESLREQLAAFEPAAEKVASEERRVGFLFTGQGSQYGGMGRELYENAPVYRAAMERCAAAWKQGAGESLIELLYPAEGAAGNLEQARHAQPALFAFEYALAELWRSWGVEPSVLLGHSLGEYVAAVVAGVFSMEDGLKLVCARARLMDTLTIPGTMRAISASAERVEQAIAGDEKEVGIAVINGPERVVISGAAEAVARVAGKLEAEGIRTRALEVTHAFHSPLLDPILDEFEHVASEITFHAPRIRMISNRTGKAARAEEIATPRYWREHMRGTVQFYAGLEAALATGCQTWIEIGPQPHLLTLAKSAHDTSGLLWLPSARRGRNAWLDIFSTLQALYKSGAEINWKALYGKSGRPIALPTYPFERQRHWFQKKPAAPVHPGPTPGEHPLLGRRLGSPLAEIQFQSRIGPDEPAYLGDHIIGGQRIVPAAAYLEMALSAAHAADPNPSALASIAFLIPCIFDEPRILQCVLDGSSLGGTFAIYSCPETSPATEPVWILHATGSTVSVARKVEPEIHAAELKTLEKRCTEQSSAEDFYRIFDDNNVHFGPQFRTVVRVFRGSREALVELALPGEARRNNGGYQAHPIALDACFQAVVAAFGPMAKTAGTLYFPAALDQLQIFGDLSQLGSAHAVLRNAEPAVDGQAVTADIQGFDSSGNILLQAAGLVMRTSMLADARQSQIETSEGDPISNLFYTVEWTPLAETFNSDPAHAAAFHLRGTCAIYGPKPHAASLSQVLGNIGARCVWTGPKGLDSLASMPIGGPAEPPLSDVFYLAPDEPADASRFSAVQLIELESAVVGECLQIAQTLLQMDIEVTPRLWILTRGAQGPALSNVVQSPLWGMARSIAAEHPELRAFRLDMDPSIEATADVLLRALQAAEQQEEVVLRGEKLYVPRLRPMHVPPRATTEAAVDASLRLELIQPGTIEGIECRPSVRRDPGAGEIEIRVRAAGLNFRDVLHVLGMYKGHAGPLGGECAGTVVRVGAGVDSILPGDEVVALGQGCFATFLTTRADLVWQKPAHLSFAAAVTIPIAFLTAWYALHSLAKIQPRERVLIHAGAGGVGLAAIQIARHAGAIVFATAGSPGKRAYLRSIGVEHVMDSRSLDFVPEVRALTGGEGIQIILNSLVGAFIDAGMEILAPGGRFIELGAAEVRTAESVARSRPDIVYSPFNLAPALEAGDNFVCDILDDIFKLFDSGVLEPLPREIFSLIRARDAFRYMAQARHIGRVVVCPAQPAGRCEIRKDGAYLVTGGMAGIGLAVAEWIAQQGAAQVLVMGRSAPDAQATETFATMQAAGAVVTVCLGDVAVEADVAAALAQAKGFPLRGVFHAAGVLDDGTLMQQDWTRFRRVLSPKFAGAWNLDRMTANSPLDHFVLFSSVASVFGSPGQASYCAANASLDAMAHLRGSRGLPALSINWGAWSETGQAARQDLLKFGSKIGLGGLSTRDGLRALEMLMGGTPTLGDVHAQVVAAAINWEAYFTGGSSQSDQPFLEEMRSGGAHVARVQGAAEGKAATARNSTWLPQLQAAPPAGRPDLLLRLLADRAQTTLGLSAAQEIDPSQPLQELGLDSLLSIELRNSLCASLERSLPATLLFNYPTLATLSRFILREVLPPADGAHTVDSDRNDSVKGTLLEDIEALSDEEVDRLLSARTAGGDR